MARQTGLHFREQALRLRAPNRPPRRSEIGATDAHGGKKELGKGLIAKIKRDLGLN
jgi:hypothetical protein